MSVTAGKDSGEDRLHLTGELKDDDDQRISGDEDGLTLKNKNYTKKADGTDAAGVLNIAITGKTIENFTEELVNKKAVEITEEKLAKVSEGVYTFTGDSAFTDYVLKVAADKISSLTVNSDSFMSKLSVSQDDAGDDDALKINNLNAGGLNVSFTGENIEILGRIITKNILINAKDGNEEKEEGSGSPGGSGCSSRTGERA